MRLRAHVGEAICILAVACLAGGIISLGATYQVGATRPYRAVSNLPALKPGDVVVIDPGTYKEVKRWTHSGTAAAPICIRGVGTSRPVFDATGLTVDGAMPNPRAVFQVEANFIVLEQLEFRHARNGNNGAGVRVTGAHNVTVRNCRITQCDMGVMSDNCSNLLIEGSEVCSNGTSLHDGYSHNFYLGGNSVTLRFCHVHDAVNGQNFKSRAHYTELFYNYIADSQDGEVGLVDARETAAPNSHAVMVGNLIVSKPRLSRYNAGRFIQFGQDSGGQRCGTLFVFNNTFVAGDGRIQFLSANCSAATILAQNNIFYGSDKLVGTLGGGVSGANNWVPSSAVVPRTFSASFTSTEPGFVNRLARDFHLIAAAAARDRGLDALSYLDGAGGAHSGVPTLEYVNPLQSRPRFSDGRLDLGAFEFQPPDFSSIRTEGVKQILAFVSRPGPASNLQRTAVANAVAPSRPSGLSCTK